MNNRNDKGFVKLFIFYGIYSWFTAFGTSILPVHFLGQGINFRQMMWGKIVFFAAVFFLILMLKKFESKKSWQLACFLNFAFIVLAYKIISVWQFYFMHFLFGAAMFFFFIFYNIAHFRKITKEKTGFASALMFSVGPIIGIFGPLLAGYTFEKGVFWFLALAFFFVTINFARRQNNFLINFNLITAFHDIKETRSFIFLQGVWEALTFGIIPIFTLYFIKTPISYGFFLTYLALISVMVNILLGKMTDKIQKRAVFLYPLTICISITTSLFYFAAKNLYLWIVVAGLMQFLVPLFYNISTAIIVDAHLDLGQAMPARELVLSIGRILGLFFALVSFYFENIPQNIFFIFAAVMLFYPIILFYNIRMKKYKYL